MALITADAVLETSTTTGIGTYALLGAVTGHRTFGAVCANNDTSYCYVQDVDSNGVPNGGWETGLYTWTTGGNLARTVIHSSSNGGAAVNWTSGTRRITIGVTATAWNDLSGVKTLTAGENVISGNLVYLNSADGEWYKADNNLEATCANKLALSLGNTLANASGSFMYFGYYVTSGLTIGNYWVGTAGAITATKPTGSSKIIRYVGFAETTNLLRLEPSEMYIELV